jgi:hypothetical protein
MNFSGANTRMARTKVTTGEEMIFGFRSNVAEAVGGGENGGTRRENTEWPLEDPGGKHEKNGNHDEGHIIDDIVQLRAIENRQDLFDPDHPSEGAVHRIDDHCE